MSTQIKLYLMYVWHLLATLFGWITIDRTQLKQAYKHHSELAAFFGRGSEETHTLELIRSAAGRRFPKNLDEFIMVNRLITARNVRKEVYNLLIRAGDISPMDLMLKVGLSQQRRHFAGWLVGHEDSLIYA